MRKLYKVCLLLMLSASNTAHAITINFIDGSWQYYFESTVDTFLWTNDSLYIHHMFTSDFPMSSRASYLSVAKESGAISFDWEIWLSDSFSQPTSVAYDAEFLGVSLFSGILNSNHTFSDHTGAPVTANDRPPYMVGNGVFMRGHAEVMIVAGDRLVFWDFVTPAPFAQNYNFDIGIRLLNVKSIPEPSTAAMIALGLAGLLGFKRSKNQRN
jgi:PEP-CTERM motif